MYSYAVNITYRSSPSWIPLTYDMGLRLLTSEIKIVVAITNSFQLITNAKETCKRLTNYLLYFYIVIFDNLLSYVFKYWRLGQLYNSYNDLNCSIGYNGNLNNYYFYSQIKKTNNGCIVSDHYEKWWLLTMSKIFLVRLKFE
jgi:hypothetical protein